jgi:hypothetical protein
MRSATAVVFALTLAAGLLHDATAAIVRCESADGRVAYSNSECPPGTKLVRKVEQSPPVVVHDGVRPPANTTDRKPAASLERARPRPTPDPIAEDRQLTEQLAAQRRECEARLRDIERLRQDLEASSGESRASAELALRRAQDDHRSLCPRSR